MFIANAKAVIHSTNNINNVISHFFISPSGFACLEAMFIGFYIALSVRFPPLVVGFFLLAFLASGENTS